MASARSKKRSTDFFASVAAQQPRKTGGLTEPGPPQLPNRLLPARRSDSKAAFKVRDKLDTAEKLGRALAKERKRVAPFLRNLAPVTPSSRIAIEVEECDWRLETDRDRRDFVSTLNGAGSWKRVALPHFGGPVGRATAYYRSTFEVTEEMLGQGSLHVCFNGVDYEAHVFVNGRYLGSHEGFFAPFEFDFSASARPGENVLVVKVENDSVPIAGDGSWHMKVDGDKLYAATGPGWDDPELGWHHCPPGMGIYQKVTIEARPTLFLADLFVRPLPEEGRAEVWLDVFNSAPMPEPVSFEVSVFGQNFRATLFRDRVFAPQQQAGPRLNNYRFTFPVPKPRLWDLDTPWLYEIQVKLPNGDAVRRSFGMRSFRMDTGRKPYGRFYLNGREIRLRGANTMGFEQQDVIKGDFDQLRDDLLLAKICHMNFWRLTQRPVQPEIYDMCDKLGLLTQTDLPLFGLLPRRQFCEAVRQAEEMERLVRNHPCNIVVSYINEPFPIAWGDKTHRHCTRAELELFFDAADRAVRLGNPDRVIKPVDGDYDPPAIGLPDNHCYTCWYNGHGIELGKLHKGYWQRVKPDWFYGCGEFGVEGLDPVNLMRKNYPKAWLPQTSEEESAWSPDRIKEAQTASFHYMFFDTQGTLDGWVAASQRHQAWATKFMTDAFRRDSRMNSIAIHLFIDAFPAGWMKAIMDVERNPKPAFFAYREALTPLMANIRTDRFAYMSGEGMSFEFWVCNDTHTTPNDAYLRYQLELDGRIVFAQKTRAKVKRCTSTFQGFLRLAAPTVEERCTAVLRLALASSKGRILHDTAVRLDLFPTSPKLPRHLGLVVVGPRNGRAAKLARELGAKPTYVLPVSPDSRHLTILIDDIEVFRRKERRIAELVHRGATAVFLELPIGEHKVSTSVVQVRSCEMEPRHFVSRASGHPMVKDFKPEDFRLWYDPAVDRISPFLDTCFHSDEWTTILTTGNKSSNGKWMSALAVAERRCGAGRYRICQVALTGRTAANPVAGLFARRLIIGSDET